MSRLLQWFTRLGPLAIVYFLLVFGFAILYSRLPVGSFAQMSAQMDPSYRVDLRNAQEGLALEIKINPELRQRLREVSARMGLPEDYDMVVNLRPPDGPFPGIFAATIGLGEKGAERGTFLAFRLAFASKKVREGNPVITLYLDCRDCPDNEILVPRSAVDLPVSIELYELLSSVSLQQRNWLPPGSKYFDRFLYYSAITSTTVGYGDIVPLTGWARLLCAVQSAASVVLLGLFVNALWLATSRLQRPRHGGV